ncbi:ABC transporter permease [Acetobacterium bakii]|uniref:ABC transporter permease n=1 Tax=Acetobacterium bakii TaxID=52689 RepID=A0A0L6U3R3_9FIRM|nr:ABC transporter permease [Acetobacterium bakii]KNZ43164.1 ABC transporter permease [Acetobacterium bakii]
MIKVNSKKVIAKLSWRSLKANRSRNIIAVCAIALTAILFTTLFTLGIGTVKSLQEATMRQAGGDGHAVLKYISDDDFNKVKDHPLIKEISYNRMLCDGLENPEFLKRHAELWYLDDVGLRLGFCEPTSGHKPAAENEIITDTKTLSLLGVPQEVGAPITLTLNIRGANVQRDFVLAGWWESDPTFNVGQILTSRAYVDAHMAELQNNYSEDHSLTGAINPVIMFKNSLDLESKLNTVLVDSGYSLDETAPNYLDHNVNWAYLSTNFGIDAGTMIALVSALALIVFTGYLIIYNIFQISVIRDMRFYGLLKTIGTTGRQIRGLIRRQAIFLSVLGIPIGLLAGFFIGKALVPLVIKQSSYSESSVSVAPNPWIFIGSTVFVVATVLISTRKPGKMAADVSPVEAVRYTDGNVKSGNKIRKSKAGGKPIKMALANLGRNKKRTVLVIVSLSLSLVLLNTVFTLSQSIDMDKYLSKFVDTDFLIAHADYFQNDFFGKANETTASFVSAVESQPGFEKGGGLYGGREEPFTVTDENNPSPGINSNEYGDFIAAVYGLDGLPLERLELIDGALDYDKLATGNYILEGVKLDDNGNPEMDSIHYQTGQTMTLHNEKGTGESLDERAYTAREFTVLGHVAIKTYSNSDRIAWGYTFYLPADVYTQLVAQPAMMSYAFNVEDRYEAAMGNYLGNYTENVEPVMNYTSKLVSATEFEGMRSTVIMIGGALSVIIGLIGILNFINAMLTSIITRRQEFAMLESIGMTRPQLRRMLGCEGLYYALGTAVFSLLFGVIFSLLIVQWFCGQLWFFSYHFIIWPLVLVLPLLIVLGVIIPLVLFTVTDKQSIVERLREAE